MRYIPLLLLVALIGCAKKPPTVAPSPTVGTPPAESVPNWGVKPSASSVKVVFLFPFNVDTLDGKQRNNLKAVAQKANRYGKELTVTGYADTVGSNAYNMALGLRRANSARLWLTLQGCLVPISVASYGEVKGIPAWSRKVTIE